MQGFTFLYLIRKGSLRYPFLLFFSLRIPTSPLSLSLPLSLCFYCIRHLISTYILHVGQLDTHFLSRWMKSHSSLSIHYISQTTIEKLSRFFIWEWGASYHIMYLSFVFVLSNTKFLNMAMLVLYKFFINEIIIKEIKRIKYIV